MSDRIDSQPFPLLERVNIKSRLFPERVIQLQPDIHVEESGPKSRGLRASLIVLLFTVCV